MEQEISSRNDGRMVPHWLTRDLQEFDELERIAQPYPFRHPDDLEDYVCLHQNDYLRLSMREEVREAKAEAIRRHGNSFLASTVFQGGSAMDEHHAFRTQLASAMRCEDVILTSSGWSANVGLIEAIAREGTPIYLDQKVHASLWDGARLSAGRPIMIRHNDPSFLEARIRRDGPGIVCIDSFYSTTGAVCELEAYVEICEKTGSVLVLDEAHSLAMVGPGAGGLAVELDLADRVHFRTASFSKALGGHGGCIATTRHLAWFLTHRTRSVIFSSSVLPCDSAAHRTAFAIARAEPELAGHCLEMGDLLRSQLRSRGVDPGASNCQIVSIPFPSVVATCRAYGLLRDRHVLAAAFTPPATPAETGLLRFSTHSKLHPEEVVHAAEAIAEVVDILGAGRRNLRSAAA